jgi:hypothetical protein
MPDETKSYQVVLRVAPVKTVYELHGATAHQKRRGDLKESIDTARSHLNEELIGTGDPEKDVVNLLPNYQKAHEKSALCAEMILTANREYFDKISPEWRKGIYTDEFLKWKSETVKWLKKEFPVIASLNLHMDEEAPHFHAFILPVATKIINYRRGSKEVTRIRYNDVFGDTAQQINAARKAKNSELTKLGRMQTSYANAMRETGLKRGIKNSLATNTEVNEFQNRIKSPIPNWTDLPTIPQPSKQQLLKAATGFPGELDALFAKYNKQVERTSKKNLEIVNQVYAKAKMYDEFKERYENMKKLLIEKDEQLELQGVQLRLLDDYKIKLTSLRNIDMQIISERLEYTGEPTWKNAIDMVKELGDFTYNESIAWLYNEFGVDTAVNVAANKAIVIAENIVASKPERPATATEKKVAQAISNQLESIDADDYRLTLHSHGNNALPTYVYGKKQGNDFHTAEKIISLIPMLRRENARGYSIYVTPRKADMLYCVVDDVTNETLPKLHLDGYTPNVLFNTSGAKMQAVFKLPKSEVTEIGRALMFREFNDLYGDKDCHGNDHPFRLAGFMNKKPKYEQSNGHWPIVRVYKTTRAICLKAVAWCKAAMDVADLSKSPAPSKSTHKDSVTAILIATSLSDLNKKASTQASFEATKFYRWIAEVYGIDADYSRADWMLAQRMKSRYTPDDINRAIWHHSPGLQGRHHDAIEYVQRTLTNVLKP